MTKMTSTRPTQQPAGMRRRARVMSLVNVPMRLILGLPFPTPLGGALMLLYLTGRKTAKRYKQPVSYVRDGDVLLTPGGGRWKLNLREGEPVRIRLRGKIVRARPEFVRNADEVERLLHRMAAANPRITSFVPLTGAGGGLDRGKVENAVKHGFAIIRWHLERPRP